MYTHIISSYFKDNSHSYTPLPLALGIVIKPMLWLFASSQYPIPPRYPGLHDPDPLYSVVLLMHGSVLYYVLSAKFRIV